jgi:hypothetical protein
MKWLLAVCMLIPLGCTGTKTTVSGEYQGAKVKVEIDKKNARHKCPSCQIPLLISTDEGESF